jgi:pimeloyl-ACP methyl ester carboxylesterase
LTGISSFVSPHDEFFSYLDPTSTSSCKTALDDLESYIATEGPFDGIMAFSQGAGLAASLMIRHNLHRRQYQQNQPKEQQPPPFKIAIFFFGGVPGDPLAIERGEICMCDYENNREIIDVPTAHIWGRNDGEYPTFGPVLSWLCKGEVRSVFVHEGGHEIPGLRDREGVGSAVGVIRRTVERALGAQ